MISISEFIKKVMGAKFIPNGRDYTGLDCYSIVFLCYRDVLGIDLKEYRNVFNDETPRTFIRISDIMNEARNEWDYAKTIREFDMIQLRTGRHAFHVGLALDDKTMLHADDACGVVIEKLNSPMWRNRIEWIYRHKYMREYHRSGNVA